MKKRLSTILLALFMLMTSVPSNVHAEICTEHQWEKWNTITYPSCVSAGRQVRNCKVCSEQEFQDIPAYGHAWGRWEIIDEPACDETGTKVKTCYNCYAEESQEIPKTQKHYWGNWKTVKQATALSDGKKVRYCTFCDKKETKAIDRLKAKVLLKEKSVTVERGKSHVLKIKSKTRGDKIEKWKSSNKTVAIVDSNGKVTGKQEGTAAITLKMESGVTTTCKVRVTRPKPVSNPQSGSSSSQGNGNNGNTVVPPVTNSLTVYITDTGSKYHRDGCRYLSRSKHAISKSNAQSRGYDACSVCRP